MISKRLDLSLRKNKGKSLMKRYKEMFVLSGFQETELKSVNIEKSDEIKSKIKASFPKVQKQVEILSDICTFRDSRLLKLTFAEVSGCDECFIFSDDVEYCGMYIVSAKSAQEYCLNVAKLGYSNTCFLVNTNFRFSFTINYHIDGSVELKNKFDIQLKSLV